MANVPLQTTTLTTDPNVLLQAVACIDKCIPDGAKPAVIIWLLCQLTGMSTDPNFLLQQSVCIDKCIPQGAKMGVMIWLLANFSGGANSGGVACGNYAGGQPTFTPASGCAIAVDSSNNVVWIYISGAWHNTGISFV